jgi:predicted  nucleic acid-binding Zn-ribbon protein
MQNRSLRYSAFLLAVLIALSICSIDADAQRRRKRRVRRVRRPVVTRPIITNPAIAPAGSEQPGGAENERIISTADQSTSETEQTTEGAQPKKGNSSTRSSGDADMQQTINALSNQVDRLNDKLTQMQQNDRTLIDMERLTRAEQRAENLRAQQVDVESKLADLQSKVELIDYQLKPENIERAAGFGTVHPEEAREARRRQLENERSRALAQIKILEISRTRLETSVATADTEVDSLRRKIETQQAQQDSSGTTSAEPRSTRRPKPQ